MQNKPRVISGTLALAIMLVLVIINFPSVYAAGKDFGHTIYQVFSNRK